MRKIRLRAGFPFFACASLFLLSELRTNYLVALLFSLLHEAGHLIPMLLYGNFPKAVVFTVTGIRIDCRERLLHPIKECVIALCGPLVNLTFVIINIKQPESLVFAVNLGLLLINLLPLTSLDGGRILLNLMLFANKKTAERTMMVLEAAALLLLLAVFAISFIKGVVSPSLVMFSVIVLIMSFFKES